MGQKTNPIGNRLGIIRGWDSNWFGGRRFEQKLVEDDKIRKYLNARLAKASISKIYIERTLKLLTVTINSARPGLIIGRAGSEVDKLREELKKLTGKDVQINISEVKRPEMDAVLVIAGRIGGAEIARSEHFKEGRTPLHTLRADIDYANAEAHTTYGRIGIKVWICRGVVYGRPELVPSTVGGQQKDHRAGAMGAGRRPEGAPRRRQGNRNNNSK